MAMLPIQPAPFFASKNRAFWNLQFAGWGGVFLLRSVVALANGQPLDLLVVILMTSITGFSISLMLSVLYRQLINQRALLTWGLTTIALFLGVAFHASIDAWIQGIYLAVNLETTFLQRLLGLSFIPATLLGGWSALYYAINYFLTIEQQADRLERLEAQATAAQLAMLRYQLNPHFLFNTLNSISTLVLIKKTNEANAMLTRLSKFLRHSLIAEPGSQITLEQEIETLELYLDIERMRFEHRLRTQFDIEDAAVKAMLPSMLLQPLVENAIKYAVSPLEEGAKITVTAQVASQRLRLSVADTGPGVDGPKQQQLFEKSAQANGQPISTGVGLANIRSRLQQAYGDGHLFTTRSEPGGGFKVQIEIPYEQARESASELEADSKNNGSPAPASSVDSNSATPQGDNAATIPLNPARSLGSSA
ncbi:MAG: histidine kinase [Erythrobacter sp.]